MGAFGVESSSILLHPYSEAYNAKLPAPWQPDDASLVCTTCWDVFTTWTRRRHHCRACGSLVCAECSPNFMPLPSLGYHTPVRVCKECTRVITCNRRECQGSMDSSEETMMMSINACSPHSSSSSASASSNGDLELLFDDTDVEAAYEEIADRSMSKQKQKARSPSLSSLHYQDFVKSEAVNWLVDRGIVSTRSLAMSLFHRLIDEGLISEKKCVMVGMRQSFAFYMINDRVGVSTSDEENPLHTETSKRCLNCSRSFLSCLSVAGTYGRGFCSIDCKTNAEFSHSDRIRASELCA
jgi:hypothetical protein